MGILTLHNMTIHPSAATFKSLPAAIGKRTRWSPPCGDEQRKDIELGWIFDAEVAG